VLPEQHSQAPGHRICGFRIRLLREMHVVLHGCFSARVTQSFLRHLDGNALIVQYGRMPVAQQVPSHAPDAKFLGSGADNLFEQIVIPTWLPEYVPG